MIWSTLLRMGKYSVLLKFQLMKQLSVRSSGVSSRVSDTSLHIIFLDYDDIVDERLKEELVFLQSEFKLGNFYVLETRSNGRHAVCIDVLRFKDVKEVVDFSSCDLMFKKAPMINEYRCWVLRYAKKVVQQPLRSCLLCQKKQSTVPRFLFPRFPVFFCFPEFLFFFGYFQFNPAFWT